MSKNVRNVLLYVGLPLVLLFSIIFVSMNISETSVKTTQYEIVQKFFNNEISEFEFNASSREMKYKLRGDDKNIYKYTFADASIFYEEIGKYVYETNMANAKNPDMLVKYNYKAGNDMSWIAGFLPMVFLVAAVLAFGVFMMKRMNQAMGGDKTLSFGKAKFKQAADDKRKTTFADVAGADEEKEELMELVDFLKNPQKFNELGAHIPKGVLMVGPPGTGKTLLSRAVAGEANVPFFSISGSDFVEMFVGVGASRVRDLFEQAKKNAPAIVFIDEIDAVGRQRGAGLGGGNDEREQTLNQLLVEMDGFGVNEGVIVIAATNRPDVLDSALLRPGRFDRQIMVNYPDVKGREEILRVHARGKPLAPDVSLKTIAQSTAGFTGADLENLLNEAALLAARKKLKAITNELVEEATVKVVVGVEKRSHVMDDKDKMITAYHEAGHAIVSYFLPTQDPVHQISIIPRGMAAGYTLYLPEHDKSHISKTKLVEDICGLLGGRAAEQLTQRDICTGASNDIKRATEIARKMVMQYGMSEKLGPVMFGSGQDEVFLGRDLGTQQNYSEKTSALIDEEIGGIVSSCYTRALDILKSHMDKLHKIAEILFTEEKIDGERFRETMNAETAEQTV